MAKKGPTTGVSVGIDANQESNAVEAVTVRKVRGISRTMGRFKVRVQLVYKAD